MCEHPEYNQRPYAVKIGIPKGPIEAALARQVFGDDFEWNARYFSDGSFCRKIIDEEEARAEGLNFLIHRCGLRQRTHRTPKDSKRASNAEVRGMPPRIPKPRATARKHTSNRGSLIWHNAHLSSSPATAITNSRPNSRGAVSSRNVRELRWRHSVYVPRSLPRRRSTAWNHVQ